MSSMQKGSTAGGGDGGDDCCEIERLSQLMDGEWGGIDLSQSVIGLCGDESLRLKWARFHLARDAMQQEPVTAGSALSARICAAIANEDTYSNVTAIVGTDRAWSLPSAVRDAEVSMAGGDAADEHAVATGGRNAPVDGRTASRAGFGVGGPRTFAAGFGLAASVALVTVVGLNAWQGRGSTSDATVPVQSLASTEGVGRPPLDPPIGPPLESASVGAEVPVAGQTVLARQVRDAPLPEVQFVANTGAYWIAPESSQRRTGSEDRLNMLLSDHIENSPTAERHGMLPYSRLVGYGEGAGGR